MAQINSIHHKPLDMTKLTLLIMAFIFGIKTAKSMLEDFREDSMKYISLIAISFYASWKDVFLNICNAIGIPIELPDFQNGDVVLSLIKALINLVSSGVFVPITTLYVTYLFKKWLKKKK